MSELGAAISEPITGYGYDELKDFDMGVIVPFLTMGD